MTIQLFPVGPIALEWADAESGEGSGQLRFVED
jgi:hypothetical protein